MTPARPPHRKRYGWFRQYNDFPTHPKWGVVASLVCVEKCRVIAIVTCLEVAANKGTPRGSIAEFSVVECAIGLGIPPNEVRRVYKALEEIGWIDREYLSTWDDRQPDKEDQTAKERQQRRRHKIREQNQSVSRRDKRDVTPRLDSDIEREEATVTPISGASVSWAEATKIQEAQRHLPWGPVGRKKGMAG